MVGVHRAHKQQSPSTKHITIFFNQRVHSLRFILNMFLIRKMTPNDVDACQHQTSQFSDPFIRIYSFSKFDCFPGKQESCYKTEHLNITNN